MYITVLENKKLECLCTTYYIIILANLMFSSGKQFALSNYLLFLKRVY